MKEADIPFGEVWSCQLNTFVRPSRSVRVWVWRLRTEVLKPSLLSTRAPAENFLGPRYILMPPITLVTPCHKGGPVHQITQC